MGAPVDRLLRPSGDVMMVFELWYARGVGVGCGRGPYHILTTIDWEYYDHDDGTVRSHGGTYEVLTGSMT